MGAITLSGVENVLISKNLQVSSNTRPVLCLRTEAERQRGGEGKGGGAASDKDKERESEDKRGRKCVCSVQLCE